MFRIFNPRIPALIAVLAAFVPGCSDDDATAPVQFDPKLVTISIVAEVASVSDPDNLLGGAVVAGSAVRGTYVYDSTTEDSNGLSTVGDYVHSEAPYGVVFTIGNLRFATDPDNVDFLVELADNHLSGDNYLLRSANNIGLNDSVTVDHIAWLLDDDTATALTSTDLTTDPPVLGDWVSSVGLSISGCLDDNLSKNYFIRAHISSVVRIR